MTSLFGGSWSAAVAVGPVGDKMGAAEPWEKVTDGESGPTLDRGLPCCDKGRMDRRRIQDPFDETESRTSSASSDGPKSPCRMNECRLVFVFGGVNCVLRGRGGREDADADAVAPNWR